jgi:hypothetical protein
MPEWHDIVFRFGAATLIGALMGVYLGAVHGLSTAATIWFTASLGVLCGLAAWRVLAVAFVFTPGPMIVVSATRARRRKC